MEVVPSASGAPYPYTLAPLNEALDTPPISSDSEMIDRIHGPAVHWKESCLTCHGRKFFRTRLRDGEVVTVECNCREQWVLNRRMQAANIDANYARLSWHQVRGVPDDVVETVRAYIREIVQHRRSGLGLTLWGTRRGTGKTLLTTLILKEAMAAQPGTRVYFARFYDLINLYSRTWKDESAERWFVQSVENAHFLGIDDIGKESAQSTAAIGMVDQLLDRMLRGRIANHRVNIVNSNLDPESDVVGTGFERYQQDVLELLSEVNEAIELTGPSFRKIRREQKLADARDGVVYPVVVR